MRELNSGLSATLAAKQQRPPDLQAPRQLGPRRRGLRRGGHDIRRRQRDDKHLAVPHHARLIAGPLFHLGVGSGPGQSGLIITFALNLPLYFSPSARRLARRETV